VELFGRLSAWRTLILASDRVYGGRRSRTRWSEGNVEFRTVFTSGYTRNNIGRILNWVTFVISTVGRGIVGPRPDVVYASSPPLLVGLAGYMISRIRRVPLVFEVRDIWPQTLVDMGAVAAGSRLHRLLVSLERFIYRRSDLVVVLAQGSLRHVEGSGVDSDQIHFLPNGAEPADFEVDQPLETGIDGFIVVYTGAHGPANGLDFVLDAAADLQADLPQVQFLLVGAGVDKPRVVERAHSEGLTNVHFMDLIPKSEIPALLSAVDVGLHVLSDVPVFRFGVSPNKLFDYMAAGLPVITNTPGEVSEIVSGSEAGLAVAPDGIGEGVRQMVAAGEATRRRWGSNGRDFVETNRSRRVIARRLEQLLDKAVSE